MLQDLNRDPVLPFDDNTFDAVLCTVSVDYLTRPIDVFWEAGRVLKPGGLFLVIFSNRLFPQKAVRIWRETDEGERLLMVREFFDETGLFDKNGTFVVRGRPRPEGDKYARTGLPSDPVYAVYAEKTGGDPARRHRPLPRVHVGPEAGPEVVRESCPKVNDDLACPYCGTRMKKWAVPDNPFGQTWAEDHMYICFNDDCPYYVRGWNVSAQSYRSGSYRLMYNPRRGSCQPVPVPTPLALRESIVEE